jgi:ribosomal protein L37AE/L43A
VAAQLTEVWTFALPATSNLISLGLTVNQDDDCARWQRKHSIQAQGGTMHFVDKIFGKRKGPVSTTDNDWIFSCPHCGKKYRIGVDAGIMTIEETIEMMRGVGTIISGSLGSSRREDMLFSFDGVTPERLSLLQQEAKKTVEKVKEALANGQDRVWYCKQCGVEKGTYPFSIQMPHQ